MLALFAGCKVDFQINLENTAETELIQKGVELQREKLEKLYGNLPEQKFAELKTEKGKVYLGQFDDLDGDGKWDVLYTQVNFHENETLILYLDLEVEQEIVYKTNVRFADKNDSNVEYTEKTRLEGTDTNVTQKYFQFEGPGWENDLVAFRNYFDERNGIDIFGKTTSEMVLDECGLKDGPSYHELQPWGMDILKVGNSLGAGALAIQTESGLYRVGPECEAGLKVVVEGPLRSIIDFYFNNISIDGKIGKLTHRILIEAGKPFYKSQVWFDGIDGAAIVTGIVNLHADSVYTAGSENFSSFYTHDNQAYDGEKLGMAILVETNNLEVVMAPEEGDGITQTFYAAIPTEEQPAEFYFMVGWEKQDPVYATRKGFEKKIEDQLIQLSANIKKKVTISGTLEE